jgi:hypothetical protein
MTKPRTRNETCPLGCAGSWCRTALERVLRSEPTNQDWLPWKARTIVAPSALAI